MITFYQLNLIILLLNDYHINLNILYFMHYYIMFIIMINLYNIIILLNEHDRNERNSNYYILSKNVSFTYYQSI